MCHLLEESGRSCKLLVKKKNQSDEPLLGQIEGTVIPKLRPIKVPDPVHEPRPTRHASSADETKEPREKGQAATQLEMNTGFRSTWR